MRLSYVNIIFVRAGMSELADEADSKSVGGNTVWVQVPLPAVSAESNRFCAFFLYFYNHIAFPAFSNFFPIISYGLIVTKLLQFICA